MPSLNKVFLVGHCAADADLRYSSDGKPVCNFRIGVNGGRMVDGQWRDDTDWFNVALFGDAAERVSGQLTKGAPVLVEGRIKLRTWEANGKHGASLDVVAQSAKPLAPREKGDDLPWGAA